MGSKAGTSTYRNIGVEPNNFLPNTIFIRITSLASLAGETYKKTSVPCKIQDPNENQPSDLKVL